MLSLTVLLISQDKDTTQINYTVKEGSSLIYTNSAIKVDKTQLISFHQAEWVDEVDLVLQKKVQRYVKTRWRILTSWGVDIVYELPT